MDLSVVNGGERIVLDRTRQKSSSSQGEGDNKPGNAAKENFLSKAQSRCSDNLKDFVLSKEKQQGVLFLLSRSGAGKSTVLATLCGELRNDTTTSSDVVEVFSIFVGSSDASTSALRFVPALIRCVLNLDGTGTGSSKAQHDDADQADIAEDAQRAAGDLAALSAVLGRAAAWRQQKNWKLKGVDVNTKLIFVFDAVNELDADDGSRALTWLPLQLGSTASGAKNSSCVVVLSSIFVDQDVGGPSPDKDEDPATAEAQVFRAVSQRWPEAGQVKLDPLEEKEDRERLFKAFFGQSGGGGGGDNEVGSPPKALVERLVEKPDGGVPLFLRLAAFLCQRAVSLGKAEKDTATFDVPDRLPSLFDNVLKELTAEADSTFKQKLQTLLSMVFATEGGLTVLQLLQLVCGQGDKTQQDNMGKMLEGTT
ncbi:unnamed protein product [Amoebophrya sp. A25]|nr:unnamed protein product [Amoebophrya sp. A25]|eukprot:GSA25T00014831001.1